MHGRIAVVTDDNIIIVRQIVIVIEAGIAVNVVVIVILWNEDKILDLLLI